MDEKMRQGIALHRWAVIAEAADTRLTGSERGSLAEQPRHRPHLPGIGPGRGTQPVDPAGPPGPQPPVDGAARVPAHRPVRVRMRARGDRPYHRAPL